MPPSANLPAQPLRSSIAVTLDKGNRFSSEPDAFFDPTLLVERVRGMAPIMRVLRKMRIDHEHGPKRGPGDWALAYLAHVIGTQATIRKWYRLNYRNERLWRACGFTAIPAYKTVWERFIELEQFADLFEEAARLVIQAARKRDSRVGMAIVVDGTEFRTHSQPRHDCRDHEACRTRGTGRTPRLKRVSPDEATRLRQQASTIEDNDPTSAIGKYTEPTGGGLTPIPENGTRQLDVDGGIRYASGGHFWKSYDHEAGLRSYGHKAWWGGLHVKATDVFTGSVIATVVISADKVEHSTLEELFGKVVDAIGVDPLAFVADAGWATDHVHRFLVQRGVTAVIPYRKRHRTSPPSARETQVVDRHGVPRCQHCGLSGDQVRFEKGKNPRVWFECPMPTTPECKQTQVVSCLKDVRRILPIARPTEVYGALRQRRESMEHVHSEWRDRYKCGGKESADRLRRLGLRPQQLRSNAALLIEWVWTLTRQGWLNNQSARVEATALPTDKYHRRLIARRKRWGLLGGGQPMRKAPARRVAIATP